MVTDLQAKYDFAIELVEELRRELKNRDDEIEHLKNKHKTILEMHKDRLTLLNERDAARAEIEYLQEAEQSCGRLAKRTSDLRLELGAATALLSRMAEALEQAGCQCTISERMSGHLIDCTVPQIQDALAEFHKSAFAEGVGK